MTLYCERVCKVHIIYHLTSCHKFIIVVCFVIFIGVKTTDYRHYWLGVLFCFLLVSCAIRRKMKMKMHLLQTNALIQNRIHYQ